MAELFILKQIQKDEPNIGQIGDVVESMLDETEFQALRGLGWTLMDGKDVTGSQYAIIKTGDAITPLNLPDARGRFLRARDYGELTNPDGDQIEGTENPFKTSASGLSASTNVTGGHTHTLTNFSLASFGDSGGGNRYVKTNSTITSAAGGHNHSISSFTGANETAPVNLIVNMFIKIN